MGLRWLGTLLSADARPLYPQLAYEPEPSGRLTSNDWHPRR